ncbi:MAG: O-antigen ligase family protein, partial [Myxococcota bacterium]|nr:O-antigen ligase family protein [Myxococcota bacterium]
HLFLAFSLILILGSIRALNPQIMIDEFFRLYSPLLMFFLATSLMNRRGDAERILLLFAISGIVPLLCSAYHLADCQMNEIYLNGSNRLLGGYQNLRNHALMMLIFSCCGVYFFFRLERKRYKLFTALYTFLSLYFLYLTFTRATLIVFGIFLVTYLYMSGRRLLTATCLIGVTCIIFLSPSLQSRFYDFVRLFSLITATNQDLKALSSLGSGRYGLWSSSLFAYLQSPFYDIVLGLGLGHHWVLTRGAYSGFILIKGGFVDTHNDMLRILYQLGPIALGLFLGIAYQCIQAGRWLIQNAKNFWHRELGALVISLTLCILMNNALSNGINSRTTFGWSFWIIAATGFIMKRELLNRQLRSATRNMESSEDMAQSS